MCSHTHCIGDALAAARQLCSERGVRLTALREQARKHKLDSAEALREALASLLIEALQPLATASSPQEPTAPRNGPLVLMVAGVNVSGKTTSIGKLTKHLADDGLSVLLAAADTFRAAAKEQLAVWADRNTVEIISQQGGDPAAVSFDAVTAGRARGRGSRTEPAAPSARQGTTVRKPGSPIRASRHRISPPPPSPPLSPPPARRHPRTTCRT